jgi:hypothetical protein
MHVDPKVYTLMSPPRIAIMKVWEKESLLPNMQKINKYES